MRFPILTGAERGRWTLEPRQGAEGSRSGSLAAFALLCGKAEAGSATELGDGVLSRRHISGESDAMLAPHPYPRRLQAPAQSFFLFGMRGVGKSTWSRLAFPTARRVDLLDEGLFQSYLRDPALFGRELLGLPAGASVVVDEIQRLPALLNEVHRFIENQGLHFVLLGSRRFRSPRSCGSSNPERSKPLRLTPRSTPRRRDCYAGRSSSRRSLSPSRRASAASPGSPVSSRSCAREFRVRTRGGALTWRSS